MHAAITPAAIDARRSTSSLARWTVTALLAGSAVCVATQAVAQDYPSKPVHVIVPYPAGVSLDLQTRIIANKAGERFKQVFLVENRPGGGATIGTNAVARSAPDGYTISVLNLPAVSLAFNKSLPYDTDKDFDPITPLYTSAYAIAINTTVKATTLKEFIELVRANPGKYNYSAHIATGQLTMEMLKNVTGMNLVAIPYKSSTQAHVALRTNEIQTMADLGGGFAQLVRDGNARIVAVTGSQRMAQLPEVPTMAELGFPRVRSSVSVGLWGPAGIPAPIQKALTAVLAEAVKSPETTARLVADGTTPFYGTPEDLRNRYKIEFEFWSEAAKVANYKPE